MGQLTVTSWYAEELHFRLSVGGVAFLLAIARAPFFVPDATADKPSWVVFDDTLPKPSTAYATTAI
jgi:hypothetical protein